MNQYNKNIVSSAALSFSHIIKAFESEEDTTTTIMNSVTYIKEENELSRVSTSEERLRHKELTDEAAKLVDHSCFLSEQLSQLLSEEYLLKERMAEIKDSIVHKRKQLEILKTKNKKLNESTERLVEWSENNNLTVNNEMVLATRHGSQTDHLLDNYDDDLCGIDLTEFATSQ